MDPKWWTEKAALSIRARRLARYHTRRSSSRVETTPGSISTLETAGATIFVQTWERTDSMRSLDGDSQAGRIGVEEFVPLFRIARITELLTQKGRRTWRGALFGVSTKALMLPPLRPSRASLITIIPAGPGRNTRVPIRPPQSSQ